MSVKSGRIILINKVHGDWPVGHNTIGESGIYDAYVNPQGAVSIMAGNGRLLGLKPNEFSWLERPTSEIMPQRCENCGTYREVHKLIVERCPNCGADEYDLYRNCRKL